MRSPTALRLNRLLEGHKRLQAKAGYIDARPQIPHSEKSSCNARPDHTFGSSPTEAGEATRPCTSASPQKRPVGHQNCDLSQTHALQQTTRSQIYFINLPSTGPLRRQSRSFI